MWAERNIVGTSPTSGHSAEFAFEPWATMQDHLTVVQNFINLFETLLHSLKE